MTRNLLLLTSFLVAACVRPHSDHIWAPPPGDVVWDDVPLAVWADPDVDERSLATAMGVWNDVCLLFVKVDHPSLADVRIQHGHEAAEQFGTRFQATFGTTWRSSLGYIRVVVNAVGPAEEYVVIVQGLGRSLGLASDESSLSVMARRVRWGSSTPVLRLSAEDRRALTERYCSRVENDL
jgi:hypothetical protein